jgi:hypothetical protein
MKVPTFYVLVPDDTTPAGIAYARRFFVRQVRPKAGVWSVESGQFQAGHHLNVIADWAPIEGKFKGRIYQEPIQTNVRAVAAYITKAERAATREEGYARSTGDLGHVSTWMQAAQQVGPVVAAAQHQHDIDPHFLPPESPGPERYADTTRRWLQPLYTEAANAAHMTVTPTPAKRTAPPLIDLPPDPPPAPDPATQPPCTPGIGRAWLDRMKEITRSRPAPGADP